MGDWLRWDGCRQTVKVLWFDSWETAVCALTSRCFSWPSRLAVYGVWGGLSFFTGSVVVAGPLASCDSGRSIASEAEL